uniref:Uncharacterized protein n=1 Tax=Caulobacter phage BL57 TaxID=3348355 RepID=A0AB74UNS9_9VIRU
MTMNNLKNRGFLTQTSRGLFLVNENKVKLGLDVQEEIEKVVADILRDHGGYATRKQINAAVDNIRGSTEEAAMTRVLSINPRIRRDYQFHLYAFYNLAADELAGLPQMGKWLHVQSAAAMRMITGKPSNDVLPLTERAKTLQRRNIGAVFKLVLDHIDEEFVDGLKNDPDLKQAMREFDEAFSDINATAKRQIEDRYGPGGEEETRLRAKGWSASEIDDARIDALLDYDRDAPLRLIDLFCEGNAEAHERAPLSFYQAFAAWAQLDAVQLSRGILAADLS